MSKRMMFLYDREYKRYFAGWEEYGIHPLWSDEIDLALVHSNMKDADMNYELLRKLGFDLKVQD